ncbi:response regulator [Candidatus Gracilibacteria bacterium]|nr:response regulator [Candidatus Gracilibacteria bacterium]MCF7898322.1 response regulator [Candidatus Paceibacterota bacterium]
MKKIMIIEDDKDLQEIYRLNFELAGYEVLQEFDGLDGISSVVDNKPDIILLDVMMPNMDGFAFLKAMKDNTSINVPVVVCSNLSDKETYAKAVSAGAVSVLLKVDYSGKQLVDKIGHIMNGVDI